MGSWCPSLLGTNFHQVVCPHLDRTFSSDLISVNSDIRQFTCLHASVFWCQEAEKLSYIAIHVFCIATWLPFPAI